jgi:hypothetical protein
MPLMNFWKEFCDAFKNILGKKTFVQLDNAWASDGTRTNFYFPEVLCDVAKIMGMEYRAEVFTADAAFVRKGSGGTEVPMVWIESENDAGSAEHEVRKLCSLAGPLKILMICSEWDETWPHGGMRTKWIGKWQPIVKDYGEFWPLPSLFGIIVGQRKDKEWKFYAMPIGQCGDIIGQEQVLLKKRFPKSPRKSEVS